MPTRVEKWLADLKPAFDEATEAYLTAQAAAEPSLLAFLGEAYPLAFRIELLRGSKSMRDNHRWFLGDGDDSADIRKINQLMGRLGQSRSREKFRTTIRMAALIADRDTLLLMADHLADSLRYAQWKMFNGKGVDYRELDVTKARELITEAKLGEFRGIAAAALLFRQHLKDESTRKAAKKKARSSTTTATATATHELPAAAFSGNGDAELKNAAIYAQFEREYPDLDGPVVIHAQFDKGIITKPLRAHPMDVA